MSLSLPNRFLTACIAVVVGVALVLTVQAIDALVPKVSLLGFIIRGALFAGAGLFAILGFNALCDRCMLPCNRHPIEDSIDLQQQRPQLQSFYSVERRVA